MECFVSTQRSVSRGSSKLQAGLNIGRVRNTKEATASNATLEFRHKSDLKSKSKIRSLMSILVNVGFSNSVNNQQSNNNFGSSHLEPVNAVNGIRFKSKGKLNVNDTEATIERFISTIIGPIIIGGSGGGGSNNSVPSVFKVWEGQGYIAPQPTVVANFGAVETDGIVESSKSTVRIKNGGVRFWKLCTEDYCMPVPISLFANIKIKTKVNNTYTDKIGGHTDQINKLENFTATQKFYPIRDIVTLKNNVGFVDKNLSPSGLYKSVDEGLFTGNYTKNNKTSIRINDEQNTFIQPSSIYSDGDFTYKCELTPPAIKPIENFLFIRASAPMAVFESEDAPEFKIHNIRWEDPSGNLIAKYKDITLTGDGDFDQENEKYNFATYVTEPEYNNANRHNWDELCPIFEENSGYTLNMDFKATCNHDPFSVEFDKRAYENECKINELIGGNNDYLALDGAPLSAQSQGFEFTPNASIRISNIEIAASGSINGRLSENYFNLYAESIKEGLSLERKLYPSKILPNEFSNGILPEVNSVWKSSAHNGKVYYNNVKEDLEQLSKSLNDFVSFRSIELVSTSPIADSGKLQIVYSHQPSTRVVQKSGGAFSIGKLRLDSNLDLAKSSVEKVEQEFYTIESIELKVLAKKSSSSTRDFTLDVVGYCDDGLFNVTSAVDGFLQNSTTGVGTIPVSSGFDNSNYLARSSEAISSRDEYFENRLVANNPGGDHHLITASVLKIGEDANGDEIRTPSMVDSTEYSQYIVPLQISPKLHELGTPDTYNISPFFEALHLDIYPLPVGAVIAKAELIIKYRPSAAMQLHTFGHGGVEISRRSNGLFAAAMGEYDHKLNAVVGSKPLSLIENIPHGFKTPDTIKTNYSKRWRGVDGVSRSGPFDPPAFDESFYNPQLEKPFINGYYTFRNTEDNTIYPDDSSTTNSGIFNGLLSNNIINSVGFRFRTDHLFSSQERAYTTIDWTSSGHELHGKITDSFENALRVKQSNANVNFGNIECSGGFSLFTRFSPDVDVSGADYNLFNNGVILSKWDAGKDLELAIGYKDGHIVGYARDINGNNIEVKDTLTYTDYQYPVPVLLTYNDNDSKRLRLYTDNEIINSGSFDILRSSSQPFTMASGDSDLILGHSYGSGIGMNAFVTDVGVSEDITYGSILVSGDVADASKQQTTAERFFDSFRSKFWNDGESYKNDRYKLWDFVDEDSNKWHIGAFKYCEFGPDYDTLTRKIGNDYIVHNFKTDGGSYENNTQLALPNDIVTSGLAYHTQLENDMFRMHLSDTSDKMLSVAPRISKALPNGYNFAKDAIAVDTVVEHETTNDITWPDGKVGPRLIVSLYTKTKETDLFDSENWGLLNRDIHYIGPRDCWQKIISEFTIDSYRDTETEPWANFDRQQILKQRGHYLSSKDMNDMFVQYDLAYPSGSYDSTIRIHSSHVRLENALHLKDVAYIDDFNLHVTSEAISFGQMNLSVSEKGIIDTPSSGLSLHTAGLPWTKIDSSGVGYFGPPLYTSATYSTDFHDYDPPDPHLGLYFHSVTGIKVEPPEQFNLHTIGIMSWFGNSSSNNGGFFGAPPQQDNAIFNSDPVLFGSSQVETDDLGSYVNLLLDFEDANAGSRDLSGKNNHGSNMTRGGFAAAAGLTYLKNLPTSDLYRNFGTRSLRVFDQSAATIGEAQTRYGANFKTLALDPKLWTSKWTIEFFLRIPDPSSLVSKPSPNTNWFTSAIFGRNYDSSVTTGADLYSDDKKSDARERWYILRDQQSYSTGYRADGIGFNTIETGMSFSINYNATDSTNLNAVEFTGPYVPSHTHSFTFDYFSTFPEAPLRTNDDFSNNYLEETCRAHRIVSPIVVDYDKWHHVAISATEDKVYIILDGAIVGEGAYFGWPDIESIVEPDYLLSQARERNYSTIYPEFKICPDMRTGSYSNEDPSDPDYSIYLDDIRVTLGASRSSFVDGVLQTIVPTPPEGVFPIEYSLPDPSVNATTTTTLPPPPPPTFYKDTGCTLFLLNNDRFYYDHSESELDFFLRGIDSTGNESNQLNQDCNLYLFGGGSRYASTGSVGPSQRRTRSKKQEFNLYVEIDRIETEYGGEIADATFNLYVNAYDPSIVTSSGQMPLHTLNVSQLGWDNYLQTFNWNDQNTGSEIVLADNDLLSLEADDEIRGVVTMCHSTCDGNSSCDEPDIITHDTLWYSQDCVNGGVIRPKRVYNNPNVTAFKTISSGYDNNYYGVRKFTNLIPGGPYSLFITAKTGDDGVLDVPREISEWGYGTNDEVDYSGIKIVPPDPDRALNDKFGYSVDVLDDLMAVGVPNYDLVEHDGSLVPNAGSVFIYRRNPAPTGTDWTNQPDQSSWSFESHLSLPSGYLVDTYREEPIGITYKEPTGHEITLGTGYQRFWSVGQKGRELGHSVSISKHNGKEIVVAGAPGAKWNRTFETAEPEPVNIVLFVFTDEFIPCSPFPRRTYGRGRSTIPDDLLPIIEKKDLMFRYFSDPPISFNVEIIICEGILGTNIPAGPDWSDAQLEDPDFIFKKQVHRVYGSTPSQIEATNEQLFTDLKEIYNERYYQDSSKQNSNQPAIIGFFVDTSLSYGTRAVGSTSNTSIEGNGALERFMSWVSQEAYDNGLVNHLNQPSRPSIVTSIGGNDGRNDTTSSDDNDGLFKNKEVWFSQAISLLDSTLNISRLIETLDYKLFAGSNFGTFNPSTPGFNIAPPSGGAVFVFEKFDDGWKTIQRIDSPTTRNDVAVDRFGHDVAISEDGSALVIGSPYMSSQVRVYEQSYGYGSFNYFYDYFGTWVQGFGVNDVLELREAKTSYLFKKRNAINATGRRQAAVEVYDNLSPSGQYTYRLAYNDVYTGYFLSTEINDSQIKPSHQWDWLTSKYMPNPRLGYSVDLNEDGTLLAIGSPTDSIGATDAGLLWYKPGRLASDPQQWFSNVNAGAVRVLQARKYFEHDKVMQFGAWGNLHRSIEKSKYLLTDKDLTIEDADNHLDRYYDELFKATYGSDRYVESGFEDPEIPPDVGLLFIITPEIDRLSKEYIDNIQNWLGLGDRHLVLVGDDPVFETDQYGRSGAYFNSNSIINRLLTNLDSRMRLYPAANRYESMVDQDTGIYYNNIPSFVPSNTTHTYVSAGNMRGSGVADIRLYDENISRSYDCSKPKVDNILQGLDQISSLIAAGKKQSYFELHNRCNHVIKHEGDLRAEWSDQCFDCRQGKVNYKVNIALVYGTHNLPETYGCGCCDDLPCPEYPKKNYEPIPILAAAEKKILTSHIPATGPSYRTVRYISGYETVIGFPEFDDNNVHTEIEFGITHDSGNYTYLNYNEFGTESNSLFFDKDNPILEQNNKNALFMARAEILEETEDYNVEVQDTFPICVEEQLLNTTAKIVVMTTTELESSRSLSAGGDTNVIFYMNLLDKTSNGNTRVAQLGGWTERTSFIDGYDQSRLASTFEWVLNYEVFENVQMSQINQVASQYDVLWIANTDNIPSDQEAAQLKTWLNGAENRKIVITVGPRISRDINEDFDNNVGEEILSRVAKLQTTLSKLGSNIRPLYLDSKHKYARLEDSGLPSLPLQSIPRNTGVTRSNELVINRFNTSFIEGKRGELSRLNSVSDDFVQRYLTVCFENSFAVNTLLYYDVKIVDKRTADTGTPFIRTGTARIDFPVEPEQTYRMFTTFSSERRSEERVLGVFVSNVNGSAKTITTPPNYGMVELRDPLVYGGDSYVNIDSKYSLGESQSRQSPEEEASTMETWPIENYGGIAYTHHLDFTVPSGASGISVYIQGDYYGVETIDPESIFTQRLIGISGVKIGTITEIGQQPIYSTRQELVSEGTPASTSTREVIQEISSDSSQYCPTDFCRSEEGFGTPGPELADGPVTAAQEVYHQRPFLTGAAKSRITVISDASLIQGSNVRLPDRENWINGDVISFLRSLYPADYRSDEAGVYYDDEYGGALRYESMLKIVSPEKTSPAKLMSSEINSGFNNLFGGYTQNSIKDPSRFGNDEASLTYPGRPWIAPLEPARANSPNYQTYKNPMPPVDDIAIANARLGRIAAFSGDMVSMGTWCRFKVDIDGVIYEDNGYGEGRNSLMKTFGYDFLDFHEMQPHMSGYPGDLFGYKVKIHKGEVYVSAPFAAFSGQNITSWDEVVNNSPNTPLLNADLGYNGGAGSVYKFTRDYNQTNVTNLSVQTAWSCTRKFRPDTLNAGDQFGMSFDVDGDVLVISAPSHDGTANIVKTADVGASGEFVRKEFNDQFDITQIDKNDFAIGGSGNQGAVYTYENKISDWGSKKQDWVFIQKLIPQGYNSVNENDFFGRSIALDRNARSDQDYTLVVGSPSHSYGSGIPSQILASGGSVYNYDAMLRRQAPSFAHPDTNLAGRVFGSMNVQDHEKYLLFDFKNGTKTNNNLYQDGIVYANEKGEIFVEASGQDSNPKGYVSHRPFIEQIHGAYYFGTFLAGYNRLFISGKPPSTSSSMNLIKPSGIGNVYNDIELRLNTFGVLGIADNSGDDIFNLSISGSVMESINNSGDPLNMHVETSASGVDEMILHTKGHFQA